MVLDEITTVFIRLSDIFRTGEFSDVTFILKNGEKVCGHKLLFKIASPVFAAMMTGDWLENDVIEIDDINIEDFKSVMEFIYTDHVKLTSPSQAASIYKIANRYHIPYLEEISRRYVLFNLNVTNACEMLEFGMLYDKKEIEDASRMLLKVDTSAVLDSSSFLDCNVNTLETIVSEPNLNIDEISLFKSVEKWAEHNCVKQSMEIDELLPWLSRVLSKIRFLSMSVDEFMSGPYKSALLRDDQREILHKHLIGEDISSITEGFSAITLQRKPSDLQIVSSSRINGKYVHMMVRWKKKKILFIEPSTDYTSPSFLFDDFTWKISVKQIKLLGQKYLDLNLICESNADDSSDNGWTCVVEYSFKIVSQEDGKPDLCSSSRTDTFHEENKICGWNPFILWSAFTNPYVTLIKDDSVIIQVQIAIID